jgi:DNA polymerase-3 subunit epsilon
MAPWLAVDLELTGLDLRRHEIIAIGAVPIREGRVIESESFYTLVRSESLSEPEALRLHQLRPEDLADAPSLEHATGELLERLAGAIPVFHTAAVECAFLGRELKRLRLRLPAAADTDVLGRLWLRAEHGVRRSNVSLSGLANLLGLPARPSHHALGDALTTATAFTELVSRLEQAGERPTVGSLQHAALRFGGAGRFGPT